jgi:hypothetical protein
MCECGCGDFVPHKAYRFGNQVLAIEVYPGCQHCKTGPMVTAQLFTLEGAKEWGIEEFEEFDQYGQSFILSIQHDALETAYRKMNQSGQFNEYDNNDDLLSDYGLDLLQNVFRDSKKGKG